MKTFFVIMLVASVVSVFYEEFASLQVMAHNHYESRHDLLTSSTPQPDHLSVILGLTPKELSLCDEYIARAYKESVSDGYRLGTRYDSLSVQCISLAALLFLTSMLGIRAVTKGNINRNRPAQ
jgi:hypothetical protein